MTHRKKYYSLRAYLSYLGRYKYRFLLVLALFLVANGLIAIIPVFAGQLIAALAATPLDRGDVYLYTGMLIFCAVGHYLSWHSTEIVYLKLIVRHNYEFGDVLFRSVIDKPYPYFVGKFTGKIGSYVSDLSREYKDFVDTIAYEYLGMLIRLPAIIIIMFSVNVYTGIAFLSGIVLMILTARVTIRPARHREMVLTDKDSTLSGYIIDAVSNFVSVKAFRKTVAEANYVAHKRKGVIAAAEQSYFWNVAFWASMGAWVWVIIWPGTFVLNVWLFLNGSIDLAQITMFTTAIAVFADYIWSTAWTVSQFNLKLARLEESYQYLFGPHNVVTEHYKNLSDHKSSLSEVKPFKELELKELEFAYPDKHDTAVLKDITLSVKQREKVGIVGHSGSGKTTLIKLLLGYYKLPQEAVLLDGRPIDNRQLVNFISYVPQDTSLFHRSIAENIAYGTEDMPSQDQIKLAAKRAHAHEFIKDTPKSYETMVGEKGIKLSMGQRQRIAIARAFLDDKPLLILDEATSALDSESEALVQQALEDLWQDKTVLAIAHRLSTLRHMDRIIVMDKGRIVESGTHRELISKKGHYYRLWQHQHEGLIGG